MCINEREREREREREKKEKERECPAYKYDNNSFLSAISDEDDDRGTIF